MYYIEKGRIVSRSNPSTGSTSDITVRRRGPPLPKDSHAYADSGYQGLQDDHPATKIPYKKSKHHPLTKDERAYNHGLTRARKTGSQYRFRTAAQKCLGCDRKTRVKKTADIPDA